MIYARYVIAPDASGSQLHGKYLAVNLLWQHSDGTAMFRVECDDFGFAALNSDATIQVLPSLNAPASAVAAFAAKHGITPAPGDTLLNVLRKLRDSLGSTVLIDHPN